jgi:hypothetical protein
MIDLAVAAVFARGLTEEQFEAEQSARRASRRTTRPATAPTTTGGRTQPAPMRRQGWLRRLASPAS